MAGTSPAMTFWGAQNHWQQSTAVATARLLHMVLGGATNFLLHRAGIGVDVESDDRHSSFSAFPKR
jgi:hypothetical protein